MKILMSYRYGNICPADRIKFAFQKLGHEVIVAGPSSDPAVKHEIENPAMLEEINAGIFYYDAKYIVDQWGPFDLILQIEPGTFLFNLDKVKIPNAVWWIDSFVAQDFPFIQTFGGGSWVDSLGWIFTSKYNHVSRYNRVGINHVSHLPLAYDEEIHREMEAEKVYDIVFCGRSDYPERNHLLNELRLRYNVFVGTGLIYENYCRKVAQGTIAFNHGHVGEMNMRFFE
ncbi:MAG: hypothetical protein KAR20_24055, partial [Candidatus Heimdallarchaeota archaeon]|nr:hypothetical protein [Candidatus Heimdallarchaeota archaeon]